MTRIDDELAAALDELVHAGVAENRSDAVRRALRELVERHRRARTGAEIAAGYLCKPQSQEELGWTDAATVAMIAEEAW
ncbi:MAG: ribbon-helix-helix domain-containing protein [Gemmatimonadales bacterium]